jgi:hypothetical protein
MQYYDRNDGLVICHCSDRAIKKADAAENNRPDHGFEPYFFITIILSKKKPDNGLPCFQWGIRRKIQIIPWLSHLIPNRMFLVSLAVFNDLYLFLL